MGSRHVDGRGGAVDPDHHAGAGLERGSGENARPRADVQDPDTGAPPNDLEESRARKTRGRVGPVPEQRRHRGRRSGDHGHAGHLYTRRSTGWPPTMCFSMISGTSSFRTPAYQVASG